MKKAKRKMRQLSSETVLQEVEEGLRSGPKAKAKVVQEQR